MRKALVHLDLGQSFLFFKPELDIIQCFIWKSDQVWSYSQRELSEGDFTIWLVAKSAQNGVDIFFEDFLLELEQVVFDVFEVQEAEISLVNHAEDRNCIELLHSFQCFLFNLDLHMIMDLFFKQSWEFKLHIRLKSVIASNMKVLPLGHFGPKRDVIHRQNHL